MLYNTSYKNDKIKEEINTLLGKPFSFFERYKQGRIGSSRMVIDVLCPKYYSMVNKTSDLKYLNIELRPKGILVHINHCTNRYSWPIPYYQLVIFDSDHFSIHAAGYYIKVKKDNRYKSSKKFINQILEKRNAVTNQLI